VNLAQKARNVLRGLVQLYGPESTKRDLWNGEFSSGRWNCLDNTGDESSHLQIEKYANNGCILDLGYGSGTTSIELNRAVYRFYTGVDISDVAIKRARTRAQEAGRTDCNEYCQTDILTYVPTHRYNVILFGDSLYYLPQRRIAASLARYSDYLTEDGVFFVRVFDVSGKHRRILDSIESHYDIIEKHTHLDEEMQVCKIVFRPIVAGHQLVG
jgi:SAM-dependent methyltransferase